MSYYVCPYCGRKHEIFGESRAEQVAQTFEIPKVSRIPIDPVITTMVDAGEVEHVSGEAVTELVDFLEKELPLE